MFHFIYSNVSTIDYQQVTKTNNRLFAAGGCLFHCYKSILLFLFYILPFYILRFTGFTFSPLFQFTGFTFTVYQFYISLLLFHEVESTR